MPAIVFPDTYQILWSLIIIVFNAMYQSYKLIFSVLRISLAPASFVVHPLNSVISIFKLSFHHLNCAMKGKRHFYGWIRHPNLPVATEISQTLESNSRGVSNLNCVQCTEF